MAVPAGGVVGWFAFAPIGTLVPPVDDGSGVSAAKATALVISKAAQRKLGSRNIGFSLMKFKKRKRQRRRAVPIRNIEGARKDRLQLSDGTCKLGAAL